MPCTMYCTGTIYIIQMPCPVLCTVLYNIHYTRTNALYYVLYCTVQYTLYKYPVLYTVLYCTIYIIQMPCTMYVLYCTIYIIQIPCTMSCTVQYTLYKCMFWRRFIGGICWLVYCTTIHEYFKRINEHI